MEFIRTVLAIAAATEDGEYAQRADESYARLG
jgi:hypothetical protein